MKIDYEITEKTAKRLERCAELGVEPGALIDDLVEGFMKYAGFEPAAPKCGEAAAGEDLPY